MWMRMGSMRPRGLIGVGTRGASMGAVVLVATLLLASAAGALVLDVDPAQSALTPSGATPLPMSGSLDVAVGELPPTSTTTFDVKDLSIAAGGYTITLQPMASPGLGVVSAAGDWLIPTLFVNVDDGVSAFDITLPDVTGILLGNGPGCAFDYCLETMFEIDTGSGGLVSIDLVAIPEPSTAVLVALGVAGLAAARRRATR